VFQTLNFLNLQETVSSPSKISPSLTRSSRLITESDIDSEDDLPAFSTSNFVQPSLVDGDFDDFLSSLVEFSSVAPSKSSDPFSELVYDSDTTEDISEGEYASNDLSENIGCSDAFGYVSDSSSADLDRRGLLGAAVSDLLVFDDMCWESETTKEHKKKGRRAQGKDRDTKAVCQRKRKNVNENGTKIRGKDRGISNRRACKM